MDLAAPSTGFSCACSAGFHDDGGVCEPNKCNALTLSDGMIGTGSDACVNGLVLNGVFDKECDYTCMPGYTGVSTGGSSQFECGINGGTATTNYECTENQCHSIQMGANMEGSSNGAIGACSSLQQLSTSDYPSCGITCSDGYFDDAATRTKLSCLTSGGATVRGVRALLSSVTKNLTRASRSNTGTHSDRISGGKQL